MRRAFVFASIAMVCFFAPEVDAQHRILDSCLKIPSQGVNQESLITIAFFPMGPTTKPLTPSRSKFSDSVSVEDLNARLMNLAIVSKLDSSSLSIKEDPGLIIRDISPHTSNIFVFASGNRIVFFQRPLLVNSFVRSFRLRGGEFIGSLSGYRKAPGDPKPITELDKVFENFFGERPTEDSEIQVLLHGPLVKPDQRGSKKIYLDDDREFGQFVADESLVERVAKNQVDSTHVFVLTRSINGLTASVVCPYKHTGDLGSDGDAFKKLLATLKYDQTQLPGAIWDTIFLSELRTIELRDGDRIELTYLPLVYPFVRP